MAHRAANAEDSALIPWAISNRSVVVNDWSPEIVLEKNGEYNDVKAPFAQSEGYSISLPAGVHDRKGLPETSEARNSTASRHTKTPLRRIL